MGGTDSPSEMESNPTKRIRKPFQQTSYDALRRGARRREVGLLGHGEVQQPSHRSQRPAEQQVVQYQTPVFQTFNPLNFETQGPPSQHLGPQHGQQPPRSSPGATSLATTQSFWAAAPTFGATSISKAAPTGGAAFTLGAAPTDRAAFTFGGAPTSEGAPTGGPAYF